MTYRIEEVKNFEVNFNEVILYCNFTVYLPCLESSYRCGKHYSSCCEKAEVHLHKVTTMNQATQQQNSDNLLGILRQGAISEIQNQFCTCIGNEYNLDCIFYGEY